MATTEIGYLREQTQRAVEEARRVVREKRAAMDKALAEAKAEGVDLAADKDAFDRFHEEYSKPYGEAKQRATELEERLARVLDMEGERAGEEPDPDSNGRGIDKSTGIEIPSTLPGLVYERFAESAEFKRAAKRARNWRPGEVLRMDPVDVASREELRAMIEQKTLVTGASATSAGAMIFNDQIPGVTRERPFWPPRVLDLIGMGATDSDTVEYVEKTGRTNAAAGTAEATTSTEGATDGRLPESAVTFAAVTVPVELYGHWIPATARALSDAAQLRTILEEELVGGLRDKLDDDVLNGTGVSPNIQGILTAVTQAQALGTDSRSDAIYKAITLVRTNADVNDSFDPDAVVLNPNDAQDVFLEKDANGMYLYGPPNSPGPRTIWGLPVVQDTKLAAGTGLVGAFRRGARMWLREGMSLAATDSHDNFFLRNILVIKITTRLAFKTIYPGAFTEVTGI